MTNNNNNNKKIKQYNTKNKMWERERESGHKGKENTSGKIYFNNLMNIM